MANSVDPDQTAPIGLVCSWATLFDSILNSSVSLGNYLQQTTSADDIFIFFLGALRVNLSPAIIFCLENVLCLLRLLHIFISTPEHFYKRSKYYESMIRLLLRSSLIWIHIVCNICYPKYISKQVSRQKLP